MKNYYYMNDFPLNLAKGGKEEQLHFVVESAKSVFRSTADLHACHTFEDGSILHCFGDSPHFGSTVNFLKGQGKSLKFVISPNFFRRKERYYYFSRITSALGPNWWSLRREMYEMADIIIVNSEVEKLYLSNIFGRSLLDKIKIAYNTYTLSPVKRTVNLNSSERFLVSLAHLNERKNVFNLIMAAESLYSQLGIRTKLVGGLRFSDPNNIKRFKKLIENKEGVDWVGEKKQSEAMDLLSASIGHVLPSYVESPGLSNLQAYCLNKPMVCGDFPIVREYFGDAVTYCKFSHKSIYRALRQLVSEQCDRQIGGECWQPDNVTLQYKRIFEDLF